MVGTDLCFCNTHVDWFSDNDNRARLLLPKKRTPQINPEDID